MKFGSLLLTSAVAGASLHNGNVHKNRKRDLEIVTVTDVVWEVFTVTEYDLPAITTSVASEEQSAEMTPAAQPTTVLTTVSVANEISSVSVPVAGNTAVVQQEPTEPTTSQYFAEAAESTAIAQQSLPDTTTGIVSTPAAGNTADAQVAAPETTVAEPSAEATVVVAAPETTAAAPAVSSAATVAAASSSTGQYSGDGTFYELGLTACGQTYSDSDYVAAISYKLFDQDGTANPNNNPHCGKKITVYRDGKSVDVTIVDRCAGCENMYSVDLSPIAFNVLATEAEGRVPITWSYI